MGRAQRNPSWALQRRTPRDGVRHGGGAGYATRDGFTSLNHRNHRPRNHSRRPGRGPVGFPENRENNRELLKTRLQLMGVLEGLSESSSCVCSPSCKPTFNYYKHTMKLHFRRSANRCHILEPFPVMSKHFPAPSWPGIARRKTRVNALMSRPPRLLWHCASTIGVAGTSPAMTVHVMCDSNRPETALRQGVEGFGLAPCRGAPPSSCVTGNMGNTSDR
jgi:hypothetical protein